ncbi:uncharacterized protein LOC116252737 isoform X2 [Nymphaea colorata]|uniref:uncharacterized protein LOC116252737 isoform X2 n=1 Tax=Nymphaea colorata TaxID=210225 RepID=UPI00129DE4C8|nr:uncharacterized protein LOC116252737 isoform X2 [Nymphaea colorata]
MFSLLFYLRAELKTVQRQTGPYDHRDNHLERERVASPLPTIFARLLSASTLQRQMEALLHSAFSPPFSTFVTAGETGRRVLKTRSFIIARSGGNDSNTSAEAMEAKKRDFESKSSDIWKLFNDAQQNILYLNTQRLKAEEELKKIRKENDALLARVEELEADGFRPPRNNVHFINMTDKSLLLGELMLRIDSMVLSGIMDLGEASELRKFIIENKMVVTDAFYNIRSKNDHELLSNLRDVFNNNGRNQLHILHICTEMTPVASFGSLASYVTELSLALQRKGNFVEVILPKYSVLNLDEVHALCKVDTGVHSYFDGQWHENKIWTGIVCGIPVTFIEPQSHVFFSRGAIYGYPDDFERFVYFSRASLDYIVKSRKQPDILHIHNWQTAIVGPLFWDIFVNQGLENTRVLFTCHGFQSQCSDLPGKLAIVGLDSSQLHRLDRLQDNTKPHLVNILKGGIVYSNTVMVLSSVHTKEHIIQNMGYGLESTLNIHKEKLLLAPYGIDAKEWDPSTGKILPARYSSEDYKGKATCKTELRRHIGFPDDASKAIIAYVCTKLSDLDFQNLRPAIRLAMNRGAQFVIMGSSETSGTEAAIKVLQNEFRLRFINKYDEPFSHLLLAGSDIILCSFYNSEPQLPLKALKYGAAPVLLNVVSDGRRLADRREFSRMNLLQNSFSSFMDMSLGQALDHMVNDPIGWNHKIREGMSKDLSWDAESCGIHLAAYLSTKNL